jgi:2,3-bisphosphoglycerate-independent phosphoglycerate mutase
MAQNAVNAHQPGSLTERTRDWSFVRFLFLFLDGVGLGEDEAVKNPFARVEMPHLQNLLGGKRLINNSAEVITERASLLSFDACLGVEGTPQSATGQATLLTGQNVPAELGYHYGPKPNPAVAEYLQNGNLFSRLQNSGHRAGFVNAYPPRYFEAIRSGRRNYSAIPLAATSAGLELKTVADLMDRKAISADFTGRGWRDQLGFSDTPLLRPELAGQLLAKLALSYEFTFFEYWLSDYAGHHQSIVEAFSILETFDQVLKGLLEAWDDSAGLIMITSDHGNLEDLSTRHHTRNPVPVLIIGAPGLRQKFLNNLVEAPSGNLTNIAPAIWNYLSQA